LILLLHANRYFNGNSSDNYTYPLRFDASCITGTPQIDSSSAQVQSRCRFSIGVAIQDYPSHTSGRLTKEVSAEEDAHRDLLLFMEFLMNSLSKDIIDLIPFSSEGTPISASEVKTFFSLPYSVTNLYHSLLGLPSWAQFVDAVDER